MGDEDAGGAGGLDGAGGAGGVCRRDIWKWNILKKKILSYFWYINKSKNSPFTLESYIAVFPFQQFHQRVMVDPMLLIV